MAARPRASRSRALIVACLLGFGLAADSAPEADQSAVVVIAAGDIAWCPDGVDPASSTAGTAALVAAEPAALVLALGDNAYQRGTASEYERCYGPTWGRFRARTRPVPGNHEYETPGASGYFDYFGSAAGDRQQGYYSFEVGKWHVMAINTECGQVGGCGVDSPQYRWLQDDLERHPDRCTLLYGHKPRFNSGFDGDSPYDLAPIARLAFSHGVDLLLAGHAHDYERFALLDGDGRRSASGFRQFVVGTGGAGPTALGAPRDGSDFALGGVVGVLRLRLTAGAYEWAFVTVGGAVLDRGSEPCHRAAGPAVRSSTLP
jgi:hypothetical protein